MNMFSVREMVSHHSNAYQASSIFPHPSIPLPVVGPECRKTCFERAGNGNIVDNVDDVDDDNVSSKTSFYASTTCEWQISTIEIFALPATFNLCEGLTQSSPHPALVCPTLPDQKGLYCALKFPQNKVRNILIVARLKLTTNAKQGCDLTAFQCCG